MTLFFGAGTFIVGLLVGSFLNSVIYRLEKKESFFKGRSYCPKCQHSLVWFDLIPVFSFLILKGKCRYCGEKISWQYPLVELATALIFFQIFNFQFSIFNQSPIYQFLSLIYYWIAASFLIIIFVYDLKYYLIPDKIVFPAIFIAFIYQMFGIWNFGIWNLVLGTFPSLFFLVIILLSQGRWMGLGDFKLAIFMGLFLGWPNILAALFFAFLIGAIIGLGLIVLGKKGLKSEIPFGPFLVTGTFLGLFFNQNLAGWYFNLFLL